MVRTLDCHLQQENEDRDTIKPTNERFNRAMFRLSDKVNGRQTMRGASRQGNNWNEMK